MAANELTQRIREDWGTLKHFCRKHGINSNTYRVVISGHGKSNRIVEVLKSAGYIKDASELTNRKGA